MNGSRSTMMPPTTNGIQAVGQQGGGRRRDSIDEYEFDDDLTLDEQSLQQIEEAFLTQRLSQPDSQRSVNSRLATIPPQRNGTVIENAISGKRHRSPSLENTRASSNAAHGIGSKHPRLHQPQTISDTIASDRSSEQRRIEELMQQLARKDQELTQAKRDVQSKAGEIEIVRRKLHDNIAESSRLLLQKEDSIKQHHALAEKFRQANDTLATENKTLKAFRTFEAGTSTSNQLWSNVTASVARRRAAAGQASIQRDYSQSHSQNMAASVGLTTPTKRNRNAGKNIGSSSGSQALGSPGNSHLQPDDSPSARARRRQELQVGSSTKQTAIGSAVAGSVTKARKAAFPGFVNSFAKPILAKETQPLVARGKASVASTSRQRIEDQSLQVADDEVFRDHANGPVDHDMPLFRSSPDAAQPSSQSDVRIEGQPVHSSPVARDHTAHNSNIPFTRWSDPKVRQMWAAKKYSDRQAFLASLILGHQSEPCFSSSQRSGERWNKNESTLQRLLHVNLPAHRTADSLQDEYTLAVHHFLSALSNGSAMAAEDRFVGVLEGYEDLSEEKRRNWPSREIYEQELLFDCLQFIEEGVYQVIDSIFHELQIMLAIACKVEAFDRVCDIFSLMRSIIIHFPVAIAGLTNEGDETCIFYDDEERTKPTQQIEDEMQAGTETQHDAAASLRRRQERRLNVRIERILLTSLRWACSPSPGADKVVEKVQKDTLLGVLVGILEVLAHQCIHNDAVSLHCTSMLKTILEEPGALISLLLENDGRKPRSAPIVQRVMAILTQTCQHDSLWRIALACVPGEQNSTHSDKAAQHRLMYRNIKGEEEESSHLFNTFSVLLSLNRKAPEEGLHLIHLSIVIFLTQLTILHPLVAFPSVANSKTILASLVKCMQMDVDLIWNEEQFLIGMKRDENERLINRLSEAVQRICMDIRLMTHLYNKPIIREGQATDLNEAMDVEMAHNRDTEDDQKLSKMLNSPGMQFVLNGVRHSFVIALSFIAFASEPEWMEIVSNEQNLESDDEPEEERVGVEDARTMLNDVNELAAELLELVLSPDEIEACWEALADDEEEEEMDAEEEALAAQQFPQSSQLQPPKQASQTTTKQPKLTQGEVINLDSDDDEDKMVH
ncbi:uncharacterized protein FA14DRAFT_74577 [Meira miltonrushii]|uniref:Uncharacterized protein n=1 Tax=Meira miltonrushii TaxID=1280837 RepID=A0A316VAD6_9BASI|nr:uncharacterized protein FA14DRAFT_74577 [Meira miltonrushii]PWN32475.1 hypothetical protein FA14DRAFT_74577 [Meira miltonrushii]